MLMRAAIEGHAHQPWRLLFLTAQGGYRPCNRMGIAASTSPFLKVTFETAAAFLVSSTLHGDVDRLTSPASRIVLGEPVAMGTGALDLVQRLDGSAAEPMRAC
jgi:DNA-directed RNA polymerase I subunit RPA1